MLKTLGGPSKKESCGPSAGEEITDSRVQFWPSSFLNAAPQTSEISLHGQETPQQKKMLKYAKTRLSLTFLRKDLLKSSEQYLWT